MIDAIQAIRELVKEIDQTIQSRNEPILNGSCKDYAEYARATGEVKGLTRARNLAEELRSQVERS